MCPIVNFGNPLQMLDPRRTKKIKKQEGGGGEHQKKRLVGATLPNIHRITCFLVILQFTYPPKKKGLVFFQQRVLQNKSKIDLSLLKKCDNTPH